MNLPLSDRKQGSWKETWHSIRADYSRLSDWAADRESLYSNPLFSLSFLSVFLYRISRYLYTRRLTLPARLIWQTNLFLTGADLNPISSTGPGLVIIHPPSVTLVGSAGRNLTIEGLGGLGGGMDLRDIGAGPGLPLLGDDVYLQRGAMVLGPVVIGNRVTVAAGCTVTRDIQPDHQVLPHKIRIRSGNLDR